MSGLAAHLHAVGNARVAFHWSGGAERHGWTPYFCLNACAPQESLPVRKRDLAFYRLHQEGERGWDGQ
jgi:hypothetical protein